MDATKRASPMVIDTKTSMVCICNKPNKLIMCKACGFIITNGRLRKLCKRHPRTIFLTDIDHCPRCHAWTNMLVEVHSSENNKGATR